MKVKALCFFLVLLVTGSMSAIHASANDQKVKELDIGKSFDGAEGTMVLQNLKNDKVFIYNKQRSKVRFTPESTFKVANALIGLQTKAVSDEYEVKRWDGVIREFEDWNRDHTLASGMRHSVIWYYQAMARDIGVEDMQQYVNLIDYGNHDISGGIDQFWLDSSIKISAQEQVQFIENLVEEKLPIDKQHMRTVKRIMINEEADSYILHGKTGTRLSDMGLGWYVGYIETDKGKWAFATNMDGSGSKAKAITLNALKELDIIEE
ncbi:MULTISPECIES: class D beta-lactamase [Peribacillus]|uniref:class D beta-lactamase n=1 Tax=Peribacillus TaxID=2675229 RepID=UPI001F4D90E0|nr:MULTISPECIES: class D beta-lactamase [unclassified Peribacillus]MCK1981313.1 class D beta-lactamase [Peribacillus sp. Aquil_B1]MCK2006940.1 class D beta-lactamase [Peribacillus sp. Aquil_B8]